MAAGKSWKTDLASHFASLPAAALPGILCGQAWAFPGLVYLWPINLVNDTDQQ